MGSIKTDFKKKKESLMLRKDELKDMVLNKVNKGFREFLGKEFEGNQ